VLWPVPLPMMLPVRVRVRVPALLRVLLPVQSKGLPRPEPVSPPVGPAAFS
jgi:hypothetical protein